jgi:5-methylcytosine-specific restriction enzyme subunit McrC
MHQHHSLREFEALARSGLNPAASGRMQALDETGQRPALNWSRRQTIAATNWVGTMQVPGWSVDILPKAGFGDLPEKVVRGRLLRMLAIAGMLPIEERDLHHVTAIQGRLWDCVAFGIARRLSRTLLAGIPRLYQRHEEDSTVIRGRLCTEVMARQCPPRLERPPIAYDELSADTPLTRTLLDLCRRLIAGTTSAVVRQAVREPLDVLEQVAEEWAPSDIVSDSDRNSARFQPFIAFHRLLIQGRTTGTGRGDAQTFSLLFPMERVFEGYVAGLLRRHASYLGIAGLRLQGGVGDRYLLRDERDCGVGRLRPDIFIQGESGEPRMIIDTKWKDGGTSKPNPADLYQIHAYAAHWGCRDNVLLLPAQAAAQERSFHLVHDHSTNIRICFLSVDQPEEIAVQQLGRILSVGSVTHAP